jgi:hypothetical protein
MMNPAPPTLDSAYAEIERRVKRLKALSKRERDAYNEDNTRKDFIMPLFRALREDRRLRLKDRIDELDNEIDRDVFELYGLTEDEIKIVKESERA